MDKELLKKFLRLMASKSDPDAVMGLRGAQDLCRSEKVTLEDALQYAFDHVGQWKKQHSSADHKPVAETAAPPAVNMSGVPECRLSRPGILEIVPVGNAVGDMYQLPGESAQHAEVIALHLKDAIVAAVVNKSRFKIKLSDVKNQNSEVTETVLRAEYDRAGMTPVMIWANNRGEVGALATVLRKIMSHSLPELMAA